MRSIIISGIIFIWMILGYVYFMCCAVCGLTPNVDAQNNGFSLRFSANVEEPIIGPLWSEDVRMITRDLQKNQLLEIKGIYYSGEKNHTLYENLGQARAESVANILKDYVESHQIIMRSKRVEGSVPQEDFPSIEILRYDIMESRKNENVDSFKIYYPFDSAEAIDVTFVQRMLSDMNDGEDGSGKRIMLTGHTDSIGTINYNHILGMKRAISVERLLMDKGVDNYRIITLTKGELSPVADNFSIEGRADNRRTVVRVIK